MFDALEEAVKAERDKIHKQAIWLSKFVLLFDEIPELSKPWKEKKLIYPIKKTIPIMTKIAGVDGGLISEAMSGFDIILYRAVATIFHGIGQKVEASYIPNFDPDPRLFFSPSLSSRQEFANIATLMRLLVEYEVAIETIKKHNSVTILFIDGKVSPLSSDFGYSSNPILTQAELDVKETYRELIKIAHENNVLLCGIVKDSRSRELTKTMMDAIPKWIRAKLIQSQPLKGWRVILSNILDQNYSAAILKKGERTSWLSSHPPLWLQTKYQSEIWSCLVRPIIDDDPIRIEIFVNKDSEYLEQSIDIMLGSLSVLCNHGLPIAIPTIIMEADDRARLSNDHLEAVVDQISMSLGVPKDHLRKRRVFSSTLKRL